MRVVFSGGGTGGHLYPGLAIARALVRERPDVHPHFVGAQRGIERDILPKTEFPFTLLDAHPFHRRRPWESWRTLRGAYWGWREMMALAQNERPRLVVGTGGYASATALLWARANKVEIVQQVGDAFPGLASRMFARWSRECYLGFAEAEVRLAGTKCIVTGNPVDPPPDPLPNRDALLSAWGFAWGARVLLIFGGSQGSRALNTAVASWVEHGVPDGWSVIWATGKGLFEEFRSHDSRRVRVVPYLSPIADAYGVADLALVRGGMMGTAECCAWGIPMIIVPLPTAAADHQTWNARALERAGAAVMLPQSKLSPDSLSTTVHAVIDDGVRLATLAQGALRAGRPGAAADIAHRIATLLAN